MSQKALWGISSEEKTLALVKSLSFHAKKLIKLILRKNTMKFQEKKNSTFFEFYRNDNLPNNVKTSGSFENLMRFENIQLHVKCIWSVLQMQQCTI